MIEWTLTLGDLISGSVVAATVIGAYWALRSRMELLESKLLDHATTLLRHSDRMDRHEARFLDVVSNLQRLIGRVEAETSKQVE